MLFAEVPIYDSVSKGTNASIGHHITISPCTYHITNTHSVCLGEDILINSPLNICTELCNKCLCSLQVSMHTFANYSNPSNIYVQATFFSPHFVLCHRASRTGVNSIRVFYAISVNEFGWCYRFRVLSKLHHCSHVYYHFVWRSVVLVLYVVFL